MDTTITVPDSLLLVEGTTTLASLSTATGSHGQVLGAKLVCSSSDGTFGVVLNGGVEGQSGAADGGSITVRNGLVSLTDASGKSRASFMAGDELANQAGGILSLKADGDTGTGAAGATGAIVLNAVARSLVIHDPNGTARTEIGSGTVKLLSKNGNTVVSLGSDNPNLLLGGDGQDGDVKLRNASGDTRIHLDASTGDSPSDTASVYVDGNNASITLGTNSKNGDLILKDGDGNTRLHAKSNTPSIKLMKTNGDVTVLIDGDAGDISLPNSDCAEDFALIGAEAPEPGTVMVIDAEGALRASCEPYDRKVAGVLSGAGDLRPGLVLGRTCAEGRRMPLALVGKVYCKVDAGPAPIEVGDLLTSSSTPGHAMKASDASRAFGAVIGKALRPVAGGTALIPILVALQ
jgi:hypothetical protein